jgi:amino acid transporter
VIFAFSGYAPAIVLAGEAKNPQRTIPLVLGGALLICFLVYATLQIALIGGVSNADIAQGWSHLSFSGSQSPFIGMAESVHQGWLHYLILVTAVVTPLGTAIIFIATSSRVAYAMSENGLFPRAMEILNRKGVPIVAVLMNFIVGMVLFFPVPGWQGMMGFLVAAFVLSYSIGPLAVLALRKQIPDHKRRFKVPCVWLWCFLSFFFANLILYWTGWDIYSKMLIGIILGLVVMTVSRVIRKETGKLDLRHSIWAFVYIFGVGLISYLGQFGGKDILPAHDDILVIAVFSALMLFFAYCYALPADKTKAYLKDAAKHEDDEVEKSDLEAQKVL